MINKVSFAETGSGKPNRPSPLVSVPLVVGSPGLTPCGHNAADHLHGLPQGHRPSRGETE